MILERIEITGQTKVRKILLKRRLTFVQVKLVQHYKASKHVHSKDKTA